MKPLHVNSLQGNVTLLSLMKAGAQIILPDGTWLVGHPDKEYIQTGNEFESTGARPLDKDGVQKALKDLMYDRNQLKRDIG